MSSIYDRVAARCAAAEIPLTAAGVADVHRFLREEEEAVEPYDRMDRTTLQQETNHGQS